MFNWWNSLIEPRSSDHETAHKEYLINALSLILSALAWGNALLNSVLFAVGIRQSLILIPISVIAASICLTSYWLARQRQLAIAGHIPPLLVWTMVTGLLWMGGWRTTIPVGYVLGVILETVINGWKHGFAMTLASLIVYVVARQPAIYSEFPNPFTPAYSTLIIDLAILGTALAASGILLYIARQQFNVMMGQSASALQTSEQALDAANRERQELGQKLERMTRRQEQLQGMLHDISAPVLPISDKIIVMPFVGRMGEERAELMLDNVLQAITQYRPDYVLLDVTGVPGMSVSAAQSLVEAVQGAQMLGSECRLVGVQPTVAQELTALDIALAEISSYSTLREGVADLLQGKGVNTVTDSAEALFVGVRKAPS